MPQKKRLIIGITGTLGAGKGMVVDYLKKKGFKHYSVTGYLVKEIEKRGMPVNRDSMVIVANDLRSKNSPSYIVEQLYKLAKKEKSDCIIESIRTKGEIEALKNKGGFYLLAIDTDPRIRYERIKKRGGSKDKISFDEFLENEKREMFSDDPCKQNLSQCIKMADFKLDNLGSFKDLYQQIDDILEIIEKDGF